MDDKKNPRPLSPEELEGVGGGISDYSAECGYVLSGNCFFCTKQAHDKITIEDVVYDCIGCKDFPGPYNNINGKVWANGRAVPVGQEE